MRPCPVACTNAYVCIVMIGLGGESAGGAREALEALEEKSGSRCDANGSKRASTRELATALHQSVPGLVVLGSCHFEQH